MQKEPLISVIVPIYNVEKYLRRCVDSILAQTYKNLEVILVDDGSPDACPAICDEYAQKDKRIKVVHKQNGGVSSARNTGLDVATGDYIAFVDSDDYIEVDMYETLLNTMQREQTDLVICNNYNNYQNKVYIASKYDSGKIDITSEEGRRLIVASEEINTSVPWNKLYKKSVLSERFDESISWGEDQKFNYNYISNCKSIFYISKPLYHYIADFSLLTVKAYSNIIRKTLELAENRKLFLEKNHFDDNSSKQAFYWSIIKPVFSGYYYESLFDKKKAKADFENALKTELVGEALANFKPCGLTQKLVLFMVKNKQYALIKLAFAFRKEKRRIKK